MYKIESGSTHNLKDTEAFILLLNRLNEHLPQELQDFFTDSGEVIVARAPGRLDLMGGIADYSGSLVLQLPIANATHAAIQLNEKEMLRVVSLQDGQALVFEIPLKAFTDDTGKPIEYAAARALFKQDYNHWAAYVLGAFPVLMREKGISFDKGAHIFINSSVPLGKGVSSSASLEVAAMQAIAAAYAIELSPLELATLCQKVENFIAGAPCGVMDQMTAACGEADKLLELLCQPCELKGTVKLPDELKVWGIDSGIRHSVGGADYGTVRTAAFMGYRLIAEMSGLKCFGTGEKGHVAVDDKKWKGYLANITPTEFEDLYAARLPVQLSGEDFLNGYQGITDSVTSVDPKRIYPVYQATRHPIYENARVSLFAKILKEWRDSSQAEELGGLMYQSHESYSACGLGSPGTDEIVSLVSRAGAESGLYGAKITGGGSGGTVAILGHRDALIAVEKVVAKYAQRTKIEPLIIYGSSPSASVFGYVRLKVAT